MNSHIRLRDRFLDTTCKVCCTISWTSFFFSFARRGKISFSFFFVFHFVFGAVISRFFQFRLEGCATNCYTLQQWLPVQVAVYCNALQHPAAHCVVQCVAMNAVACCNARLHVCKIKFALQCVAVCCSVLQCVAVWCIAAQCVAVSCSILQCLLQCHSFYIHFECLQCVAVCCLALQCVATCNSIIVLCVAVCCSVLQCLAVHCSVLQCVAMCCSALLCVAVRCCVLQCVAVCYSALLCVAVCCSVLQCVAVCCNAMLCTAVRSGVLQCVAVCCRVLQCVAVCCRESFERHELNESSPFPSSDDFSSQESYESSQYLPKIALRLSKRA